MYTQSTSMSILTILINILSLLRFTQISPDTSTRIYCTIFDEIDVTTGYGNCFFQCINTHYLSMMRYERKNKHRIKNLKNKKKTTKTIVDGTAFGYRLLNHGVLPLCQAFNLIFFRTMRFDEHFQLLWNNTFVRDFMLCYTSWCKTSQTNLIEFISS